MKNTPGVILPHPKGSKTWCFNSKDNIRERKQAHHIWYQCWSCAVHIRAAASPYFQMTKLAEEHGSPANLIWPILISCSEQQLSKLQQQHAQRREASVWMTTKTTFLSSWGLQPRCTPQSQVNVHPSSPFYQPQTNNFQQHVLPVPLRPPWCYGFFSSFSRTEVPPSFRWAPNVSAGG